MPRDTFFHINPEKQDRLLSIGTNLYTKYYFEEVSVKMIVELAHIPRGSFYAYFQDLEDFYFYVLSELQSKRVNLIEQLKVEANNNYFTFFKLMFQAEMELYKSGTPNLLLLHYYHYLQTQKTSSFKSRKQVEAKLYSEIEELYPSILSGRQLTKEELEVITEMIMNTYIQTYLNITESTKFDQALQEFHFKLQIIEEGLKQC